MPTLFDYKVYREDSPFWVFAIHDGHQISPEVAPYLSIDEKDRLREEDPYTASMAELPVNRYVVGTSRFQLDINRKQEASVYHSPELAWGLTVWKSQTPANLQEQLYDDYSKAYDKIDSLIQETIDTHGFFVVLDIHSYNAKRSGPDADIDTEADPQINLGSHYNKPAWRHVIDHFMQSVSQQKLLDEPIDIRENVKFKGGHLAQHLLEKFGDKGCVLSVEFRKDFMDEWTGIPYTPVIQACKQLLMHALQDLQKMELQHGVAR
ncbi:N-formylglutamate amidohydrolase [Sphingobacterium oryzagri]|uniref:N-formylglutamate amidohydrolase n=1 Tax=Sphingobacterium oryzagri TaxID=3025669 RepID=A0ABY7WCG7_9SPHI|nr:N-formylglutamate amidohydrolase [Sphingobacterium sp. KACC 22765]WDF67357.1 N-formylglutamate amidohydrolase [Sphingobacterium sp. KACC 22765]